MTVLVASVDGQVSHWRAAHLSWQLSSHINVLIIMGSSARVYLIEDLLVFNHDHLLLRQSIVLNATVLAHSSQPYLLHVHEALFRQFGRLAERLITQDEPGARLRTHLAQFQVPRMQIRQLLRPLCREAILAILHASIFKLHAEHVLLQGEPRLGLELSPHQRVRLLCQHEALLADGKSFTVDKIVVINGFWVNRVELRRRYKSLHLNCELVFCRNLIALDL